MITGLTKKQKTTLISFDEDSDLIRVQTHNADLRKRLAKYAAQFPKYCRKTDDNGLGGLTYEIQKGRLSFRLSEPYNDERKSATSSLGKDYSGNLRRSTK